MKKFNILAFLFIFLISNNLVLSSEPINVDMVLQDQNEQARYNREKRNIEKNLRECLKENEGKEISKLGVPKVCAKFVKEFIWVLPSINNEYMLGICLNTIKYQLIRLKKF